MTNGLKMLAVTVAFLATSMGGCRTFTDPSRGHKVGDTQVSWIDYDATRRGTYVVQSTDDKKITKTLIVAEPPPDAAVGAVVEFVAKANYQGMTGEASAKVTETIAELGKRTQAVMILREAMYRIGEMYLNNGLDREEVLLLQGQAIDAAEIIALGEVKDPAAAKEQAKANQMNAIGRLFKARAALDVATRGQTLTPEQEKMRQQMDQAIQSLLKQFDGH